MNELSLKDLAKMAEIIDVCTQRGAFRAQEMMVVGELYNKITAFLEVAKAAELSEKQEQEESGDKE